MLRGRMGHEREVKIRDKMGQAVSGVRLLGRRKDGITRQRRQVEMAAYVGQLYVA